MEKITLNGQRYISLAEFEHERKNMAKAVYERCEHDDDGKLILSDADRAYLDALYGMMSKIMEEEVEYAENPDAIREMHQKLDIEYALHRYLIVGKYENGETVFFRKYCEHIDEEELTPVFTGLARLAKTWTNHYYATTVCESLRQETGEESLEVKHAWIYMLPPGEAEKRLLSAIFGECDENKDE